MAIFTGIGAALFGAGTFLAGATAFVLKTVAGIGLNLLAQAIAGKPQDPKFSVNGNLQSGGDLPRSIMLGYSATAGSLVYANTWGRIGESDNAFLTQVIALSDLPVRELREVWVNGELCTLADTAHADLGFPVIQYRMGLNDHLWIKFYDGKQTAADEFLVSNVSSAERPYASTRVGRGVSYVIVTALVTQNLFSGIPSFKFALHGAQLYDITKDSTVGGSGTHVRSDPSTWGGDGDFLPAVQIYNLLRGIEYEGDWLYGIQGMTANRLPSAHWAAQINKCRAAIGSADGEVPTYRAGGELSVDAPLGDAIEALLTSCQGRLTDAGGAYKLYCGAPGAPVASISDGEILSTEEQSFTPFFGLADTINGISARYPSPAEGWNPKVASPLYRPDLEALAGNRRLLADVTLDFVPYAEQVQRLMKSALEEAQRARRHTFVLPPEYWVLEPGDIVSWTSERNGYVTKLFRVDGVVDRANLDVMVDLTEVDPADYDWDSETEFSPPVDGAVGPVRPTPQPIKDWDAAPYEHVGADGRARAAILLSWDGNQPDVDSVRFRVRDAGATEAFYAGSTPDVARGAIVVTESLVANTDYEVQGEYWSISGRPMEPSGWLPVTTPDVRLGRYDIYEGVIGFEHLAEDLADLQEWISSDLGGQVTDHSAAILANAQAIVDEATTRATALAAEAMARANALAAEANARATAIEAEADARTEGLAEERDARVVDVASGASRLRDLTDSVARVSLALTEVGLTGERNRVTFNQELVASFDRSKAGWTEAITVAVGEGSAVAQRFTALEASVAGVDGALTAAITTLEEAIVDGDTAEAGQRESLAAQLRGDYEGGDASLVASGLLYQQRQAMVTELQALAVAISLVSAGVGEQFDHRALWHFTYDAEDFTGNGTAPTAAAGFLRPADGADPWVQSPAGLAITNNEYSQVKLRLRKIGAPTWRGWVWWNGPEDESWSTERRVTLAEPDWDVNGESVATWTMGWSGTIDRIRIETTAASSGTDRVEYDWIAVGRPAPGASSADIARVDQAIASGLLAEASAREALSVVLVGEEDPEGLTLPGITSGLIYDERVARATADAANTTLIDGVQASLGIQGAEIDALAASQTVLTGSVTALEDLVTANAAAITDVLADLDGKADAGVTDSLQAQIDELGGGTGFRSLAEGQRSLRAALDRQALANIELGLFGQKNRQDLDGLVATVNQTLTARIDAGDGGLVALGQAVTAIELALPGFATTTAVSLLEGRTTVTEDAVDTVASSVTALSAELDALEGEVGGKASAAALDALDVRVTETESGIDTLLGSLTALSATVDGKASLAITNALDGRLTVTEAGIVSAGSAITAVSASLTAAENDIDVLATEVDALEGVVSTKASASAVTALDGRVTETETGLDALASAVTALDLALDGKASVAVTDALYAELSAIGGGSAVGALAGTVRGIRLTLDRLALANAELGLFAQNDRQSLGNTIADVSQVTNARIDLTEAGVSVLGSRVDLIELAVPGFATLTLTNALDGRITATEAGVESTGSAVTAVEASLTATQGALDALESEVDALEGVVSTKAEAEAVTTLEGRVTSAEGSIGSQSTALTSLSNALTTTNDNVATAQAAAEAAAGLAGSKGKVIVDEAAPAVGDRLAQNLWIDTTGGANTPKRWDGAAWVAVTDKVATDAAAAAANALAEAETKAEATALMALDSRVTSAEGDLTALSSAVTALGIEIDGKASISAITVLEADLAEIDGTIAALSSAFTSVEAEVDGVTAGGNFRMQVQAGPAGYSARIGAQARAGGTGSWREASWYLDVPTDTEAPTRFVVVADQAVFVDPDDLTNMTNPIVFQEGEAMLQVARIDSAIVNMFQTPSGKTRFGVFGPGSEGLEIFS